MATERTLTFPIEGMSCQHCAQRVKDALDGIEGVSHVDVDLDEARATVTADERITRDQLAVAVADAGYRVPTEA